MIVQKLQSNPPLIDGVPCDVDTYVRSKRKKELASAALAARRERKAAERKEKSANKRQAQLANDKASLSAPELVAHRIATMLREASSSTLPFNVVMESLFEQANNGNNNEDNDVPPINAEKITKCKNIFLFYFIF